MYRTGYGPYGQVIASAIVLAACVMLLIIYVPEIWAETKIEYMGTDVFIVAERAMTFQDHLIAVGYVVFASAVIVIVVILLFRRFTFLGKT